MGELALGALLFRTSWAASSHYNELEIGLITYSDPLIDCTSNERYSWVKGGVSWTRKGTTNRRWKVTTSEGRSEGEAGGGGKR